MRADVDKATLQTLHCRLTAKVKTLTVMVKAA
jgi:hypothetical protein